MTISRIENFVECPRAHIVFAHGAGADKSSGFMEDVTELLNESGFNVTRFNFPYMDRRLNENKKFPPDRMPKLLACFEQVLAQIDSQLPIFLMGKSMGSRVATILSGATSEQSAYLDNIQGVIALGYPFHPIGKPEKLRVEPVQALVKPALILQGERDKLGDKTTVSSFDLPKSCKVVYLPDGDHDLKPRVKSGLTHAQNLQQAMDAVKEFIGEH